jgi:hypothetical protein
MRRRLRVYPRRQCYLIVAGSLQHEDGRQISDGELLAIIGSEDEPPPAETEH